MMKTDPHSSVERTMTNCFVADATADAVAVVASVAADAGVADLSGCWDTIVVNAADCCWSSRCSSTRRVVTFGWMPPLP